MSEPNLKIIGKWIKFYREQMNLSREKLAEITQVCERHIQNIESGNARPSTMLLFHIAETLHVSTDDLTKGAYPEYPLDHSISIMLTEEEQEFMQEQEQNALKLILKLRESNKKK